MCKTTKGRQTASANRVPDIQPNTATGSGGGTPGSGAPFPEGPAPLIGEPEFLPQITFIPPAGPLDNGFIGNAMTFHQNAGLTPVTINSLEHAVELLNTAGTTGSGIIDRLRIVSHFFVNDEVPGFTPSNIKIPMLNNGGRGVLQHQLTGWATSNYEGLKAMLTIIVISGTTSTLRPGVYADSLSRILNQLRPAQSTIIDQIPTGADGEPTGLLKDFVLFAASKWAINQFPTIINDAGIRSDLMTAYDLLLTHLKGQISTPSPANLNTLETAMVALGDWGAFTEVHPTNMAYFGANVSSGIAAFNSDFFAKITTMRTRFNQYSKVDIRGCQAGRDLDYLRAIRQFFGTSATVRPTISAPDRFQRFNGLNQITGLNSQADLTHLYNSGISPFSAANLRGQLDTWANGFGITQAHIDFWKTTFQLHVLEFCKLQWRTTIPTRQVVIPRLDNLATASFNQVFTQLSDIFFFTTAQRPTAAQVTAITPLLPNLDNWTTELNAAIPDTATPAQLQPHFDTLKTIYEAVDPRTSQATFNSRIIPSTAPPLTVALIRSYQANLKAFIQTNSNSVFAPVKRFLDAGFTQANAPQARLSYFFRLGLVLQLYHPTSTNFDHQIIIAYTDSGSSNRRQDEAIRHWIRACWRGVVPPAIPASVTWENGRNGAWIVEGRNAGPSYVCPHPSYKNHVIVLNASAT